MRDSVAAALGAGYQVKTGERYADDLVKVNGADNGFITVGLLLFGLVAMFVAALVIYNTFNILIAQRTREMALLRCIGATRGQVFGSIVLESAVVGLVSSVLGLLLGYGLGAGALAVLISVGAPVPSATAALAPRTIVLALLVGLVVTVGVALLPARSAMKVAPSLVSPTSTVMSSTEICPLAETGLISAGGWAGRAWKTGSTVSGGGSKGGGRV